MIGNGIKKPIASNNFYPNRKFVMKNCTVETENGKTYLSFYSVSRDGTISTTASHLERLCD